MKAENVEPNKRKYWKMKITITEEDLIAKINEYDDMLFENKKISASKYDAMQVALVGARYIINDAFNTKRKLHIARHK